MKLNKLLEYLRVAYYITVMATMLYGAYWLSGKWVMPKIKLEFNLPEEKAEYESAYNGALLRARIEQFHNKSLRGRLKYDNTMTDQHREILEQVKEEFAEILGEVLWGEG